MRVLYIAHSCPYPPNKGDRIRNFHVLKYLARKHSVILIYPSFSHSELRYAEQLNKFCESVKTIYLSKHWSRLRCCLGLLRQVPLTNTYFFSKSLQRLIDSERYDLALADCSSMAQYIQHIEKPKIVDLVDVDSEKWHLYAQMTSFPKSWIYQVEYKRLRQFEATLVRTFDVLLVISESEKRLLPQTEKLFVVGNGIDLDFFSPRHDRSRNPTLIFTGAMNYFPNIDAVLYFHHEVFPLIRQQIPGIRFIIGGMDPSPEICRLQSEDTIVTGFVPDMREYLARASVCVVPLRIARGVQNKILEAMAMGIPVVSTSLANQGIGARHEREILLADDPQSFSQAVIKLLRDQALHETLAINARQFVEAHFTWESRLQNLDQALLTAMSQR
ncbi:MAG: TIGR03087 family PEP-CTERM/XrtA system glycosyltransferase [Nitrospirae bacterium]|nr:MAG: TIGR03087 family PEP-CTERM/XrtA system glycosyltransferase [Nitrospirota bacterium]